MYNAYIKYNNLIFRKVNPICKDFIISIDNSKVRKEISLENELLFEKSDYNLILLGADFEITLKIDRIINNNIIKTYYFTFTIYDCTIDYDLCTIKVKPNYLDDRWKVEKYAKEPINILTNRINITTHRIGEIMYQSMYMTLTINNFYETIGSHMQWSDDVYAQILEGWTLYSLHAYAYDADESYYSNFRCILEYRRFIYVIDDTHPIPDNDPGNEWIQLNDNIFYKYYIPFNTVMFNEDYYFADWYINQLWIPLNGHAYFYLNYDDTEIKRTLFHLENSGRLVWDWLTTFAGTTYCNIPIQSKLFTEYWNPIEPPLTGNVSPIERNKFPNLIISNITNFIGLKTEMATWATITFEKLMELLKLMYGIDWDVVGGILIIEHETYFLNGYSYHYPSIILFDLSSMISDINYKYAARSNKISYEDSEEYYIEILKFENSEDDIQDAWIYDNNLYAIKETKETTISEVSIYIESIHDSELIPELTISKNDTYIERFEYDKDMYVFLDCLPIIINYNTFYQIQYHLFYTTDNPIIADSYRLNATNYFSYLFEHYLNYNKWTSQIKLHYEYEKLLTPFCKRKIKRQEQINFKYCNEIPIAGLVKTELGYGKIKTLKINLITDNNAIELLYE